MLRVTTEIGTTTLKTKTSLTGKSFKMLLPGMHITPEIDSAPSAPTDRDSQEGFSHSYAIVHMVSMELCFMLYLCTTHIDTHSTLLRINKTKHVSKAPITEIRTAPGNNTHRKM